MVPLRPDLSLKETPPDGAQGHPGDRRLLARLGGFESAGFIHRVCAVITFAYFAIHLWDLFRKKRASGKSWMKFIFDKDSMVPNAVTTMTSVSG